METFIIIAFAIILTIIVIGFESKSRHKRRMTIKEEKIYEIKDGKK